MRPTRETEFDRTLVSDALSLKIGENETFGTQFDRLSRFLECLVDLAKIEKPTFPNPAKVRCGAIATDSNPISIICQQKP
ncbi:hypothetical protein CKA32_003912 [Geitlerinema sp. FC II]|nr:hypothetical protein CKA32_003912 [Geitlerinema sp. FC II]